MKIDVGYLIKSARKHVLKIYAIEKIVKQEIDLYKDMLD